MTEIKIHIKFNRYTSHKQLVSDLAPAFIATKENKVNIQIDLNVDRLLYSDFLILVVAAVTHLRTNEIPVSGNIKCNPDNDKVKYASRVNFFKLLGLDYKEKYSRKSSKGKFTELTPYTNENVDNIFNKIRAILIANVEIIIEVQQLLDYCMYEIMDNVINHSALPIKYGGKGWCCAQLFPQSNEIRLLICDTGIGIHQALSQHPQSKYKGISEQEAITLCTQKDVTNGEGMGFGLFATSEFIKLNGGEMTVYSGNHFSHTAKGQVTISSGMFWQGTFVYLRIYTQNAVDYKKIMPEGHTLPDDYQFFLEKTFGFNDDLW